MTLYLYQKDGQWYVEQRKRIDAKYVEVTTVPVTLAQAIIIRMRFHAGFKNV